MSFLPLYDSEAEEVPLAPEILVKVVDAIAWAKLLGVTLRIYQQPESIVMILSKEGKISESWRIDEIVDATSYVKNYAQHARPWNR